jgi:hypothetical protein
VGPVLAGRVLIHFDRIGYVFVSTAIISMVAMSFVQKAVAERDEDR